MILLNPKEIIYLSTLFLLDGLRHTYTSAESLGPGLIDPATQPHFEVLCPNPLDPSLIYNTSSGTIEISAGPGVAQTGLVDVSGELLDTPIWGYGVDGEYTWPGKTFELQSYVPLTVAWRNRIPIDDGYLLTGVGSNENRSVVDKTLHWAYSIHGYETIPDEEGGTPIVVHVHGGHQEYGSDGNPEFFYSPGFRVKGPQWVHENYFYDNTQGATQLWYHDHTLGITRLNVYTGMAGFYTVRDDQDTGKPNNPLNLPAFPYEVQLLIQDRIFKDNGELFWPAFKGDPAYDGYIIDEDTTFDQTGPSALAEYYGDTICVNGKIWPKLEVEPRQYRFRLLNGCDSRFLVIELFAIGLNETDVNGTEARVPFTVIGSDEGLGSQANQNLTSLLSEPAGRYDIIFDFSGFEGERIIMKNGYQGEEGYNEGTLRIMSFDVVLDFDDDVPDDFDPAIIGATSDPEMPPYDLQFEEIDRVRKVALFEGRDEFNRLLVLLGTAEPATDENGNPIMWPDTEAYRQANITGQMNGAMTWDAPTTENPKLNTTEMWEIWNLSPDPHPIHIHLVHFDVVGRKEIIFDTNTDDGELNSNDEEPEAPAGDGTYIEPVPLLLHNGAIGTGFVIKGHTVGDDVGESSDDKFPLVEKYFPRDMVVALPGQVTTIRARFDKPGRYNWHCHISSHEDAEMMRVVQVGPIPDLDQDDSGGDGSVAEGGEESTLPPTGGNAATEVPTEVVEGESGASGYSLSQMSFASFVGGISALVVSLY